MRFLDHIRDTTNAESGFYILGGTFPPYMCISLSISPRVNIEQTDIKITSSECKQVQLPA